MSRQTQTPIPIIGSRLRLLVALAVTLSALLTVAAPRVHAQGNKLPDHPWHVGGDGEVEVIAAPGGFCPSDRTQGTTSGINLTLDEGGRVTYCLRLTKQPVPVAPQTSSDYIDDWWVLLRISDGEVPITGDGDKFQFVPSVGRQFTQDNWGQWASVTITALQDTDGGDHRLTISHEVWDSHTNCPYLLNQVGVQVYDDDGPNARLPALSIADNTVTEGTTAEFTVTLTGTPDGTVSVAYSTTDGTAHAGDDYNNTTGSLTFTSAGSQTIQVPTIDDGVVEDAENFSVSISSNDNVTIEDGTATGTINDNDETTSPLPTLSIADNTVTEGTTAEFTVTLTGTPDGTVSVAYSTTDGTAHAGDDYNNTTGSLTFTSAGSQTIQVPTIDDGVVEDAENFSVSISSNDNVTIEDGTATGTINDNDETTSPLPTLSIADNTVTEGTTAEFTVTLTGTPDGTVSVAYSTTDGDTTADRRVHGHDRNS